MASTQDQTRDWLRLHLTKGIGKRAIYRLLEPYTCLSELLEERPNLIARATGLPLPLIESILPPDAPEVVVAEAHLQKIDATIISAWDCQFPDALRHIPDPPALLYVRGELKPQERSFAVVGSRRASNEGYQLTKEVCHDLANRGINIVSGLARGIDTAAHMGALQGETPTFAVLGCGVDRVYPPENSRLFHQILENGAIISEFPPGTPPLAINFPARNRIISGLCQGVLIVEAAEGSGSLITADFALEQGRDVFAIPGPIHHANSFGPHRLLKQGATLVTCSEDITQELWPELPSATNLKRENDLFAELSESARSLCSFLQEGPVQIDLLIKRTKLTPMCLSDILLDLELRGVVQQLPGMRYMLSTRPLQRLTP